MQQYQYLEKEKSQLFEEFHKVVYEVHQKTGLKNLILEKKLETIEEANEVKDAQINQMFATTRIDPQSLGMIRSTLEEVEQLKNKMKLSFGGTRKDLEAFFASLDKDRNHVLEFGEVADGLRGHMSRPEVLYIWKLLDINGDGLISVDEFVDFFEREDDV